MIKSDFFPFEFKVRRRNKKHGCSGDLQLRLAGQTPPHPST
ncbi:hypothetical protein VN97_g6671, partial [Penicillium thymicola]